MFSRAAGDRMQAGNPSENVRKVLRRRMDKPAALVGAERKNGSEGNPSAFVREAVKAADHSAARSGAA